MKNPAEVATELTDYDTHPGAEQSAERLQQQLAVIAEDVIDVIAIAVIHPQRMSLNEILLRPTRKLADRAAYSPIP